MNAEAVNTHHLRITGRVRNRRDGSVGGADRVGAAGDGVGVAPA